MSGSRRHAQGKNSAFSGGQSEQRFEVIGAPASLQALDVEAGFGGLFLFDQIQGDAPQDGEVLGNCGIAVISLLLAAVLT